MRFSRIVSAICHPLLLPTYLVLVLSTWVPALLRIQQGHFLTFFISIFIITFIFPALSLLLFRQLGIIQSLRMETRRERIFPFVFNSLLFVFIAGLFLYKGSVTFANLMVIVAGLAVTATLFTIFFKISVHSLCWSGLAGIVIALNSWAGGALMVPTVGLILVTGIVMSARLKLNAHSLTEVMVGSFFGFVVGFAGMKFLF